MISYLKSLHPRDLKVLSTKLKGLIKEHLWVKIIVAMFLGVAVGVLLSPSTGLVSSGLSAGIAEWVALPGQIFLTVIQMIVIPLIFASVIRGIAASEDLDQLKKVGLRLVAYFLLTTTLSIIIGLSVASIIRPGAYIDPGMLAQTEVTEGINGDMAEDDMGSIPSMIVGLIPQNPLSAMVESQMLQIVIFAIVFGIALTAIAPKEAKPLLEVLGSLQEVCMSVVAAAMKLAPIAVFGLIAQITIRVGLEALLGMGVYMGTVLLGLLILLIVYLLIVTFAGGVNPIRFLKHIREVQLLAFSASSSAAVMPLSIETAEDKLHVRPSIAQFLIPLGTSINMDGTALYQAVATVFLAQVFGVELGIAALALVVLTTVGASIGSPATPGVGIVILATVLAGVGIPAGGIALILGVDRVLDMSRTMLNVTGDLTAAVVMDRWIGGEKSYEQQVEEEMRLEQIRIETRADVIIDEE